MKPLRALKGPIRLIKALIEALKAIKALKSLRPLRPLEIPYKSLKALLKPLPLPGPPGLCFSLVDFRMLESAHGTARFVAPPAAARKRPPRPKFNSFRTVAILAQV